MTKKRRKWPRRVALLLGGLVVLLLLVWILRWPLFGGLIRREIASALEPAGIRIEVDDLSGSLLASFEAEGVRLGESPGLPMIRSASIERLHATFSIAAFLRGENDWIHDVRIEGVRAEVDLDAPAPPSTASGGGGPPPLPRRVHVADLTVTVRTGPERLVLTGLGLEADATPEGGYDGTFAVRSLETEVEGIAREVRDVSGHVLVDPMTLVIDGVKGNGVEHGKLVRADLSGLAGGKLSGEIDVPLFSGRVRGTVRADLSGETPSAGLDLSIEPLDPRPLLRLIPDVPLTVRRIGGQVELSLPPGSRRGFRDVSGTIQIDAGEAAYEGRGAESASIDARIADGEIRGTARFRGPDLSVTGAIRLDEDLVVTNLDLTATPRDLDLAPLAIDVEGHGLRGRVGGTLGVAGPPDALAFSARDLQVVAPGWNDRSADRLVAESVDGPLDRFAVKGLAVSRGEDRLEASGTFDLAAISWADARAKLVVKSVDAWRNDLPLDLPPGLDGALTLTAEVAGEGDPTVPGARLTVEIADARYEDVEIERLTFTADVPTDRSAEITDLAVTGRRPDARVNLKRIALTRGDDGLSVDASGLNARVGETLVVTDTEAFHVKAGLGDGGELRGTLELTGVDLERIAAAAGVAFPVNGEATGKLTAGGTTADPRLALTLDLSGAAARPPGRKTIAADTFSLSAALADGRLSLDELAVAGEGWSLRAEGSAPARLDALDALPDAPLTGRARLEHVPLGVSGRLPEMALASGTLDADVTFAGTVGDPTLSGPVRLDADRVVPTDPDVPPVTDLKLRLRLEEFGEAKGRVEVEELTAKALGATVTASGGLDFVGGGPVNPRLSARITDIDLAAVSGRYFREQPVEGRLEATLDLAPGPNAKIEIHGRDLRALERPFDVAEVIARYEGGVLTIEKADVTGEGRRLTASGTVPFQLSLEPLLAGVDPEGLVDLTVTAEGFRLREGGKDPEQLRFTGLVGGDAHVVGPLDNPKVTGRVRVSEGTLRAEGIPTVDRLEGTVLLDANRIETEGLTGRLGGGAFEVKGHILHANREPVAAHLEVKATNSLVVRTEGVRCRADLALLLDGDRTKPGGLLLSGQVKVRGFRHMERVDFLSGRPSLALLPLTTDRILAPIRLDVTVEAPRESVKIRNNLVDGDLHGRLDVGGTLAVPRPQGRFFVERGTIALPTVTMRIQKDSFVEFRAPQPFRPWIEATASAYIGDTRVFLEVRGWPDALRTSAYSEPPLPERDVRALITTGFTQSDVDPAALGTMAATIVYRQLASELAGKSEEDSFFYELSNRVELDLKMAPTLTGGEPTWRATVQLLDWLYLSANQDDVYSYGMDLILRLTFP